VGPFQPNQMRITTEATEITEKYSVSGSVLLDVPGG
jgi:hypothetical protein